MGLLHRVGVSAIVGGHSLSSPTTMQAVIPVGHCSGVLVSEDVILTSAHCLERRMDGVIVAEHPLGVTGCKSHPAYKDRQARYDVGLCRLQTPAPVSPIPLDDGPALAVGTDVLLAGFGQSGAFAKDGGILRVVETKVADVSSDALHVGTDAETACLGDSGGPVLVRREEGLRVAAVVHGTVGAICASAAEAVPTSARDGWIAEELSSMQRKERAGCARLDLGSWCGLMLVGGVLRRRTKRSRAASSPRDAHGQAGPSPAPRREG
jgi:hypothetical protein